MEYYYSGTESLWCGNWNHLACRRWKCEVDHPSQSTEVNLGKKQKSCSLWCPWSQVQQDGKRWISDDITWFPKYFWQMTIARSKDVNKDDTSILNLFKKLLFSANTSWQFKRGNSNSEIWYRSVCDTEIFNYQTEYTWIILIHVYTPCNRFIPTILHNYCDMVNYCSFCSIT